MNKIIINYSEPIMIMSQGKYPQALHIWQSEDGILNFKLCPQEIDSSVTTRRDKK